MKNEKNHESVTGFYLNTQLLWPTPVILTPSPKFIHRMRLQIASLILKAAKNSAYKRVLLRAVQEGKDIEDAADRVLVNFGTEILKYTSAEESQLKLMHACLSILTKLLKKARKLISLYKEAGVDPDRY